MANRVVTPTFRASYPQLFEAKAMDEKSEAKYSIQMIFSKNADLSGLKALVSEAVKAKWADKPPKKLQLPFRDGDEEKEEEVYTNSIFMNAASKFKPGVVDQDVQPILNQSEFYPGCYARASVTAYAWEYMGKAGVSLGLQNVQKVKEGDRLDGAVSAESEFEAIANNNDGNFSL